MLLVFKVCAADLNEKENSEDHIKCREDNVVGYLLDLFLGCIPGGFDCTGNITCGEARDCEECDNKCYYQAAANYFVYSVCFHHFVHYYLQSQARRSR